MGFTALLGAGVVLAQAPPTSPRRRGRSSCCSAPGSAIGVLGHLYGSRVLVGFGIAIVFVATLILPLALSLSN